ncbi:hypothetical protein FGB62_17g210 [Gracilaria domingensis]|nr:hypothetical protein FGB62_17g210 [Gracilaria domingensis]
MFSSHTCDPSPPSLIRVSIGFLPIAVVDESESTIFDRVAFLNIARSRGGSRLRRTLRVLFSAERAQALRMDSSDSQPREVACSILRRRRERLPVAPAGV